jgi:transposase
MPLQATVFSRILQQVPWAVFDRAVAEYQMDKGHRGLDARSHLVALLAGQLIEAHGLRDIEAVLATHAPTLKRRRITPACRSTLCDANKVRSPAAFEALIPALLAELSPTQARRSKEDLRLIDSTLIHPGSGAGEWAQFQNAKLAAKVHVVYDPKAQLPVFYELTSGNTNDITLAKTKMPIEAGATYVFDLGYYDFGFWAELDRQDCRFVTRLKTNTPVTVLAERPVPADSALADSTLVCDKIVTLPQRQAKSRKNPFAKPGRMVIVTLETGKQLRLFSNDLESPAEAIAELYKNRWQIELFFKWIKQNLRIRRFHGRSENAVRLQIAAAIITYLLLKLLHNAAKTTKTAAVFLTSLRHALFQRIELDTLVHRIERRRCKTPPTLPPQLEFAL